MKPKSIRLNQENREVFIHTVIKDLFPELENNIQSIIEHNAQEIYDKTYGEYQEYIDALPDWMLEDTSTFLVVINENIYEIELNKTIKIPRQSSRWHKESNPTLPNDHPVSKTIAQITYKEEERITKRNEFQKMLRQVTYECNTSGQLYKAWPRALEYAHLFPYQEQTKTKFKGPSISQEELDMVIDIAKTEVELPEQN